MTKKARFQFVIDYFSQHNPSAETELSYTNPYELIVAVVLSAQCTDKRVNLTTPAFFRQFPDPETLAAASPEQVFPIIKSISYPNNKSKHLVGMARMLMEKFDGIIPSEVEELTKLPGVGRKTANVIASVVYDKPALAVDTHVFRVAARIGLTINAKNPLQTEKQLVKHLSDDIIPVFHHWIILHGRYICVARRPKCEICGLKPTCKYYQKVMKNVVVK
ncbi:MAG: endonuclease III [Bacteroidia bacterium]